MAHRQRGSRSHSHWPVINHLAQFNVAIGLCLAAMIRLSMEFSDTSSERPDPLVVLGFFAVMIVAIVLVIRLRRKLHHLGAKWQRVVAAVVSFGFQFIVLELLLLFVVD